MGRGKIALATTLLLAAAAAALSGRWPWRQRPLHVAPPIVVTAELYTETLDTLRRGETLSELFARQGIEGLDLTALGRRADLDPRRLRSGLVFTFRRATADSEPTRVTVRTTPARRVSFQRDDEGWDTVVEPIAWQSEPVRLDGPIDNSLYEALDLGVDDAVLESPERQRLAWDLADIYAWQVDFTRDIQPGDHFRVLVERLVSEEGEVRFGRVLAADLTIGGKSLTAFHFDRGNRTAFYDQDGKSLRRAFLRAPVQFRRISSSFARARRHPVLGITRRHQGTDYAANPGTPVMAAGDGVVLRAGRIGGYGNLIELRHRNGITTRYGHLRGFARGIRSGVRVAQGQTIGYVGSTGLASGPHLHYEFRVNGVAKDPRRIGLGHGTPIGSADRAAFERQRDSLLVLLTPGPAIAMSD